MAYVEPPKPPIYPREEPLPVEPIINTVEPPATPPVVVTDAKNPISSKLNWLGVILTLTGALQLAQEMHLLDTLIPSEDLRAKVSAVMLFAGGVLTILLRTFFTYKPTTLTEPK